MTVLSPTRLDDAVAALDADPSLMVLAGGTDLMVAVNYGQRRPAGGLSLRRVTELHDWHIEDDGEESGSGDSGDAHVVLGAATTYTTLLEPALAALVPALAQASRTVGSPQIRNTGTIGGNLGTGSPAGDTLPVLVALDATVELVSASGRRTLPVSDFVTGPKQTALALGELVAAVRVPVARGPQEFLKVGVRNAMVIAVATCALVLDLDQRRLGCALGAVGPIPIRDRDAEAWGGAQLDWDGRTTLDPAVSDGFGPRMAAAARPIDDHRATAAYRRHAVEVLARRALERAWGAS